MDRLDLSPRPVEPVQLRGGRRRNLVPSMVLAGALLAAGFFVFTFLTSSTVFFCNADQVEVTADCSAPKRFRLQGTVDPGSVRTGTPLAFTVSYGGRSVPVTYQGDPGGIFCEGVPVVVEGRYRNGTFDGDRILVKHTEQYKAGNPDRVRDCGV